MIYVDPPMEWGGKFNGYCHMWADEITELHRFAANLGLKRSWFQDRLDFPHYDIAPSKRRKAIEMGAKDVDHTETLKRLKENRAKRLEVETNGQS